MLHHTLIVPAAFCACYGCCAALPAYYGRPNYYLRFGLPSPPPGHRYGAIPLMPAHIPVLPRGFIPGAQAAR